MKATDKELEDYMAGRIQLVTGSKSGNARFVPYKKRAFDRGITPPEKRAYWRVWYLKNRAKRRAYAQAHKTNSTPPTTRPAQLETGTPAERKVLYLKRWRARNRDRINAAARAKYHAIRNGLGWPPRSHEQQAAEARHKVTQKKLTWNQRHPEKMRAYRKAHYQRTKAKQTKPKSLIQRLIGWGFGG